MDEFNFEGILNDRTRVTGPWFCENCVILSCLHSSKHKYLSILMKLYHNVYGHKILDEFDYGRYPTSMSWVICPWISKNAINHFVYTLGPSFLHQSWLFLYSMFITIRNSMSSILKEFWLIEPELRALDFMKIALFYLVYTLVTINIYQS